VLGRGAVELANEVDLEGVHVCLLCLWELAWQIKQGKKPARALVTRTVDAVWVEIGVAVREAVARARMQEHPFAEDALRELEENGWQSGFAEAVVWRLARELAEEIQER
jgi:hypothetical protein